MLGPDEPLSQLQFVPHNSPRQYLILTCVPKIFSPTSRFCLEDPLRPLLLSHAAALSTPTLSETQPQAEVKEPSLDFLLITN